MSRSILDTHETCAIMLTWLVLSYPQRAHTQTDTEQCISSEEKTFCDRRREQNIVFRKRSTFSTNVGEGHSRLSFVVPVETNPVLPVIIWTKHIFEPRRRTSQSFWPRRGTTCPEPCLSKRAHLEVYKEALLSLFSYYLKKTHLNRSCLFDVAFALHPDTGYA